MQLKWPMLWDLFSLFPAYAGVIPTHDAETVGFATFPRIRGGDPRAQVINFMGAFFSPHTRG